MKIAESGSCDIPQGHDDLTITNLDPDLEGIYTIKGDRINASKKIPAGETQHIHSHHSPVKVTNTGSPMLEVVFKVRKIRIGVDGSFDIPEGHGNATITNLDPNLRGAYTIKGDTIEINKEIPAGKTQNIETHKSPVKVTNTAYPLLEVVLQIDSEEN